MAAEGAETLQGGQIGLQIGPGSRPAKSVQQGVVDEPMLGGEFGGGMAGDPAADLLGLRQDAVHPQLPESVGAQYPGQAAADDEHVGIQVFLQGPVVGQGGSLQPQ